MSYLASFYNMTTYHYQTPRIPDGRVYMLEINPYYVNGSQSDNLNVIDARWVDMTSGLFIDITAVRHNAERDVYECKDGHDFYVCLPPQLSPSSRALTISRITNFSH